MKHKLLFFVFTLILSISASTAFATGTVVFSSCTNATANQNYNFNGDFTNGRNLYIGATDATYTISWSGTQWELKDGANATVAFSTANTSTPPCSGVFLWNGGCSLTGDCSSVVLPVELTSFTVSQKGNSTFLNWSTATEINNAGFEVERSNDGNTWEYIDYVEGQGNTLEAQNYTFTDYQPLDGVNYYRLVQIDYDGTATMTDIVSLDFSVVSLDFSIYPIPAHNILNYNLPTTNESVTISIYNTFGKLTQQIYKDSDSENNIDLQTFTNGIYIIQIEANGKQWTKKFVKL